MKIHWNGFLKIAVEEYPKEACGFLFSKNIYNEKEEWFVFPVKNISKTPENQWIPDKKEMLKAKAKAIKLGLIKIGNVHAHPYLEDKYNEDLMRDIIRPSDLDLSFAKRFNDIVRIILCVGKKAIYDVFVHDKFGNKIDIILVEE